MAIFVTTISILHYNTPTMQWQYHLIFMQSYFIPILIGAFQFGIKGGLGTAVVVSIIYFPHVVLQWGGLVETNLMRFLQIGLFNVVGYFTGVKAEKELREKQRFQKAAQDLEESMEKLNSQSSQLNHLEDQLRQADRLAIVGELTASMAHEMRNPLGSIRGAVDILKKELPAANKSSEFFDILVQETARLGSVVENYLGFTRRNKKAVTDYELCDLIRNSVALLISRARRDHIRLETSLPDDPLKLKGDPSQTQQVLINLIVNAIQAVEAGGEVKIIVEQTNQKGNGHGGPDNIRIVIQDNGKGIAEEELDRIFTPFYSTKPDGTGLGLAIVKRIANENRWNIEVESSPGAGTKFTLSIPVQH